MGIKSLSVSKGVSHCPDAGLPDSGTRGIASMKLIRPTDITLCSTNIDPQLLLRRPCMENYECIFIESLTLVEIPRVVHNFM